jgi:hypothetical protein
MKIMTVEYASTIITMIFSNVIDVYSKFALVVTVITI